ncbi:hypothetical protein GQX74_008749 [Glossina fuscipes]|nr:hypothetical protein GQX74_008749 [Glossina fuscipes]
MNVVNMTLVTCHFNEANFIRNFRCMSLALQYCQATYTSMLSDFAKLICVVKVNTMKIKYEKTYIARGSKWRNKFAKITVKAGNQMTKRVNNSQTIAEFRPGHRSVTNKKSVGGGKEDKHVKYYDS